MKKNTIVTKTVKGTNGKEYGIVKVQEQAMEYIASKGYTVVVKSVRGNNLYLDVQGVEIIIPAEITKVKPYVNLIAETKKMW